MDAGQSAFKVGTLTYTPRQLGMLFFWLLWGDLCFTLMESVVPSILPLRFEHLGASNTIVGLIMTTIPMSISAVLGPIISFRSDRYRSRWGRRIPFILLTMPFLVMCLVGIGYAERIGANLAVDFGVSPKTSALVSIGVFMVAFTFFNSFVGSVFWYLFNDVVPEHLQARFMSLFRLVSMGSSSIYLLFVFQYAGQHSIVILEGVGLLYFFGFGLMCFKVKEGTYPPPPAYIDGKTGAISAVKTFVEECLALKHYWYQFIGIVFWILPGGMAAFTIYYFQATGLNLAQIGRVQAAGAIAIGVLIPFSGWLADRFHPIRVVLAGMLMNIVVVYPAYMIWFFYHPAPGGAFLVWMLLSLAFTSPAMALVGVWDPPLLMRIFPRERYGQFCSANAMIRSLGGILGGVLTGAFLDLLKAHVHHGSVYFYIPVWQFVFTVPSFVCMILLYRSWKRYGGDDLYVPPVPSRAADNSTIVGNGLIEPLETTINPLRLERLSLKGDSSTHSDEPDTAANPVDVVAP